MIVAATATLRGSGSANQDHAVVVEGAVAVLDGATIWLPHDDHRDGGWYARTLGAALAVRLPSHQRPLTDLLADAIADVRDVHGLRPGQSPHSTVSILRWDTETLEALALADSPIAVYRSDGTHDLVQDMRLAAVGAEHHSAYRQHLRHGHGYDAAFSTLLVALQRAEKTERNRPGGFWVAEAEPAAAGHGLVRTWVLSDVSHALVLSDGAAAGALDYGVHDWTKIGRQVLDYGPASVIKDVHTAESSDPHGRRWPRPKCHDDKTIVAVHWLPTLDSSDV
jgi:hypothetical protein